MLLKSKKRNLKAAREKQLVMYIGSLIRLTADLSWDTMEARKLWNDMFEVLKAKTWSIKNSLSDRDYFEGFQMGGDLGGVGERREETK